MRHLVPIVFAVFCVSYCSAQGKDTLTIDGKMISILKVDTLKSYSTVGSFKGYAVSSDSTISFYHGENQVNTVRKLSNIEYRNFKLGRKNMIRCKPCWLQTYDIFSEKLLYEGMQYTDARVGEFLTYHANGLLKEKGRYAYNNGSKKVGRWTYFDETGKVEERRDHGN